jgi:hypothetical protein
MLMPLPTSQMVWLDPIEVFHCFVVG